MVILESRATEIHVVLDDPLFIFVTLRYVHILRRVSFRMRPHKNVNAVGKVTWARLLVLKVHALNFLMPIHNAYHDRTLTKLLCLKVFYFFLKRKIKLNG